MKDSTARRFLDYARERDSQALSTNDTLSAISAALISIADSMAQAIQAEDTRLQTVQRLLDATTQEPDPNARKDGTTP